MKLKFIYSSLTAGLIIIVAACGNNKRNDPKDEPLFDEPAIDITAVKTTLPQAGNVALIEAHCMPCHSLRYIEMQPKLSYKSWEAIVNKMIHTYGAPIHDTVTKRDIINYLYAIKGKP